MESPSSRGHHSPYSRSSYDRRSSELSLGSPGAKGPDASSTPSLLYPRVQQAPVNFDNQSTYSQRDNQSTYSQRPKTLLEQRESYLQKQKAESQYDAGHDDDQEEAGFSSYSDFRPRSSSALDKYRSNSYTPSSMLGANQSQAKLFRQAPIEMVKEPIISKEDWQPNGWKQAKAEELKEQRNAKIEDRQAKLMDQKKYSNAGKSMHQDIWWERWFYNLGVSIGTCYRWVKKHWILVFLFLLIFIAGLVVCLYFVLPRIPAIILPATSNALAVGIPILTSTDSNTFTQFGPPAIFTFTADMAIIIDAASTFIPSVISTMQMKMVLTSTNVEVGNGTVHDLHLPAKGNITYAMPLTFHGEFALKNDSTFLAIRNACATQYSGTFRPPLNFTMETYMTVNGRIGAHLRTSPFLNVNCPVQWSPTSS